MPEGISNSSMDGVGKIDIGNDVGGKSDRTLLVLAVLAVVVSAVVLVGTYFNLFSVNQVLLQPNEGTVELTISQNSEITFTPNLIDWGSGFIPSGDGSETLSTESAADPDESTPNGHFGRDPNFPSPGSGGDGGDGGFILENTGNANLQVSVSASKTAATFIGGTGPGFGYHLTQEEAGACETTVGTSWNPSTYVEFTTSPVNVCSRMFADNLGSDAIRMDIRMVVPENAAIDGATDTATITTTIVGVP